MSRIYNAIGRVPSSVPPSTPVRYWHEAGMAGLFVFILIYLPGMFLAYHWPGTHSVIAMQWIYQARSSVLALIHYLMLGNVFDWHAEYIRGVIDADVQMLWRLGPPMVLGLVAGSWVLVKALRPRTNVWHLKGPRVLEGREALAAARQRSLTPEQQKQDPYHLTIHPALVVPKRQASRHMLITGAVGAGKTSILSPMIKQIVDRNDRLLLYDVKGDYTSYFRRAIILSPYDSRSYCWDVGADVRTATQANAFAASLIPEGEGGSKFWTLSAQQVLIGMVRSLQNERGTDWSWPHLAQRVALDAETMFPILQEHYPKASALIANPDSQTTASVLSTLAGFTRIIDDLALAWSTVDPRKKFAITQWILDDYKGRKQVIVQGGADEQMTRAYITALLNVMVPVITSPSLSENETGRFIGICIDELASVGQLPINRLVLEGRSKGVVCIFACQSLSQITKIYGSEDMKALTESMGTQIICQVGMGETRELLAKRVGKRKVAVLDHKPDAIVREEGRDVLHPDDLTDRLGPGKGKKFGPSRWGISALILTKGDPLLLDWPGVAMPKVREGQKPAKWTTGPAGRAQQAQPMQPVPTPEQRAQTVAVLQHGLTVEDIDAAFPKL